MNWSFLTLTVALILFAGVGWWIERQAWSLRRLATVVILATLAAAGRVPLVAFPNIQPTTFLVILAGWVLGPFTGFVIGMLAAVASNLLLGHGPWTLWQMLAWGLCGFSAGVLRQVIRRPWRWVLVVFGFGWGFLFGWMLNFWHWLTFVFPLNWETWLAVNLMSAPYDFLHACSNAVMIAMAAKPFIGLMERHVPREG